ncbi:MAG: YfjI family protein [Chloroflexota bacterium]|nr:YfjI family protein [Chloroflexota bacterium]
MKQEALWSDGQVITSMNADFIGHHEYATLVEPQESEHYAAEQNLGFETVGDDGIELQANYDVHNTSASAQPKAVAEEIPVHGAAIGIDVPPLPKSAFLSPELGKDACLWLDEYIAWSRKWSPRSYQRSHEACGLWLLSVIAARRVVAHLGGERYPNLYIAQCGRTSLWAKSTVAKIAVETIRTAGLDFLLAPDDSTPQALIHFMTRRVPADYAMLPEHHRAALLRRLAFAAQVGWFYEEFGQKLNAMMRDSGPMADYRGLFRRLDDCPERYESATIGRGLDQLVRPYLAFLTNLTLADLAPYGRKNGALWGDGFFARFVFVTPPAGLAAPTGRFPTGKRLIPDSLIQPLKAWHQRLGVPVVTLEEHVEKQAKRTAGYDVDVGSLEPERATFGEDVFEAYYRYHDALLGLTQTTADSDLDGNYARFAEKALRVAMLLASLDNGGRIELRHWARAQNIAEGWRVDLHALIDQLQNGADISREAELEDKVIRVLQKHGPLTAADIHKEYLRTASTPELSKLLDSLVEHGRVTATPTRRDTRRYSLVHKNSGKVEMVNGVQASDSITISPAVPNRVGAEDTCHPITLTPLHD